MKSILAILSLAFTFTAHAHDIVDHDPVVYGTSIEKIYSQHPYMHNVENGGVKVDLTENEITLTLHHVIECPEGFACIALAPVPTIITLPIVDQMTNDCGSVIYTAMVDKTPVDGLREVIEVVDNVFNTCPTFMPLEATEIQYTTYNPWVNDTAQSLFKGKALRLLPSFH